MPNINTLKESRFLKKEDFPQPALLTIRSCEMVNVGQEGKDEQKLAISFMEMEKPLICNSTNAQIMAQFIGSEETDDWLGHKVVLFHDPTISYAGKMIGGIRARAPRAAAPAAPLARPAPARMPPAQIAAMPAPDEDVPF